tara:strand:- start:1210 stop:1746 length:537 start_codon:yes stop_codon:yes gene_type:complete
MIIDKHKAIFIHIPKNAGTSIEEYFSNESVRIQPEKHADIYEIKKKFKNSYNNYKKFTIIRNPYDKMVSWYFYLKRNLGDYNVVEFNDWIKEPSRFWHANDPISFLKPQHEWINNTVEIIKFENLNKELNKFFNKQINLPITNKSNHKHYLEYYNTESLDIIYNRYKKDFKKFNYKKL